MNSKELTALKRKRAAFEESGALVKMREADTVIAAVEATGVESGGEEEGSVPASVHPNPKDTVAKTKDEADKEEKAAKHDEEEKEKAAKHTTVKGRSSPSAKKSTA